MIQDFSLVSVLNRASQSRKLVLGAFGLILLSLISSMLWSNVSAQDGRVVTVYADDTEQTFQTDAETVKQALERADIKLHEEDLVEPGLESEITTDSFKINIYRARPVTVVDGDQEYRVLTPFKSAKLIAEDAGLTVYDEDEFELSRVNDFVNEAAIGLRLTIDRATPITLNIYGTKEKVRTQAETVGEYLVGMDLSQTEGEVVVRPKLDQPIVAGMTVHVVTLSDDTVAVEETIPFERRLIQDTSRPIGYEDIKTPGQNGSKLVTYKVVYENGQEISRRVVDSVIITKPVEEVAVVGADYSGLHPDNRAILAALRMCETHGNYQANTGNGFFGAYQFMQTTWDRTAQRMGMSKWAGIGPHQAPPSVQDAFVLDNARASAGGFWSQHPGCSDKLNLPKFPY